MSNLFAFDNARLIVTHPGAAHLDEVLACSILLGVMPSLTIERRDPTQAELDDPTVVVVDVGLQHRPEANNFDHHQLPREAAPVCALSLVLQHLGLYEAAKEACLWLPFVESMDSKGPVATAKAYSMTMDAVHASDSPVEGFVIEWFRQSQVVAPSSFLSNVLWHLGCHLLNVIWKFTERMALLKEQAKVVEVAPQVLAIDATCIPANDRPAFALEAFAKKTAPEAAVTITNDDRGPGLCLFRRNDHPRIDFTKLDGRSDIIFAHPGGFVAKTEPMSVGDACELVKLALKPTLEEARKKAANEAFDKLKFNREVLDRSPWYQGRNENQLLRNVFVIGLGGYLERLVVVVQFPTGKDVVADCQVTTNEPGPEDYAA